MITASIVLYNQEIEILQKTIESFLKSPFKKRLFLIDNSIKVISQDFIKDENVEYIFVDKNIGFGKGHNLVIDKLNSKYHLILNPDVEFKPNIFEDLINQLENFKDVAFITPKVIYPNKNLQLICRKHPNFLSLSNRLLNFSHKFRAKAEFQEQDLSQICYPEFIHGCFMFFRTSDFKTLNGFDERYFLYMEDADICRKIDKIGKKKMYYPNVEIIHLHEKGSYKSKRLFYYHISSAIKYFLKWGF